MSTVSALWASITLNPIHKDVSCDISMQSSKGWILPLLWWRKRGSLTWLPFSPQPPNPNGLPAATPGVLVGRGTEDQGQPAVSVGSNTKYNQYSNHSCCLTGLCPCATEEAETAGHVTLHFMMTSDTLFFYPPYNSRRNRGTAHLLSSGWPWAWNLRHGYKILCNHQSLQGTVLV